MTGDSQKNPDRTFFKGKIFLLLKTIPDLIKYRSGSTSSYDSNTADLELTIKVQNALNDFKTDIVSENREYLDEFIEDLHKYNKMKRGKYKLNLNIRSIECENRKTEDKIQQR